MNSVALPLVFTLELPEATPSNNTIKGMHYRVYQKARQAWRRHVLGAMQNLPEVLTVERCLLHIERYSSGGGLDWDNAYGGLKPLLDCLVSPSARNPDGLGLIRDDGPKHMPAAPWLQQLPAKPGYGRTVVRIYDASALTEPPAPTWAL
jgi:hypothetical protein